jgi:hypothetical protein
MTTTCSHKGCSHRGVVSCKKPCLESFVVCFEHVNKEALWMRIEGLQADLEEIKTLVALIKAEAVIGRDTHGLTEVHLPTKLLNQLLEV